MVFFLITLGFGFFFLGFSFYARLLEGLFDVDASNPTPAVQKSDGVDSVPAKWPVLFGHHFASIAGAAPIIGPVLAVSLWGWVPVYWWVVLGSVFVGGLHDFGSLMLSLRFAGKTVAEVAEGIISSRARQVFAMFLWFALVLVVAVFASVSAKTFVEGPEIVLPSFGLILVAVLVGFLMNKKGMSLLPVTFIGLGSFILLIILGQFLPVQMVGRDALAIWVILLLLYALVASVAPVHYLLQPRDYLSSYLLFFGLVIGYIGLFLSHPTIRLPETTMKAPFDFWPMLFIVVACGAVSGFHSLIASGTTARQISNEGHGRYVVYLAMLAEGALALLAVFAVIVGFSSMDEFLKVLKSGGPIEAFSVGFGQLTRVVLGDWGKSFAVIMLNAFVLTTLDTATRIGRYITEEITGIKNRWITSLIVVVPAAVLALTGKWKAVWPLFGAANQLIAAMVLLLIASFLAYRKKKAGFVLIISIFSYITIMSALMKKSIEFFDKGETLLLTIGIVLLFLSLYMVVELFKKRASSGGQL